MATTDDRATVLSLPQAPDAIELRHLRSFVAVADELNFGRAATRLFLSQPALSRQIRALERLVGCDLLRRSTHRVELTLAGDALLDRARQLLRDVDDAVSATRSIGGELVGRAARLWEPVVEVTVPGGDVEELRTAYEALHAEFAPPPEVSVRPVNAGGVSSLLVCPPADPAATLLYMHGGGLVVGSAFGYRPLVGALAVAAGAGALVPDFRLAPEHPFPAALEDVQRAYLWMLDRGTDPSQICFAGDSAGGGLAVSLLLSLKQQDLPLPGGVIMLCPGLDMSMSYLDPASDPQVAEIHRIAEWFSEAYLDGHPKDDPLVNPLKADLSGLPPLLIQAATGDTFRPDAERFTDLAREQGVDVQLELYPVDTHVFQIFWSFLPEAADALHQAGEFAQNVRAGSVSTSTG